MALRISFGSASCKGRENQKEPIRSICLQVQEKLGILRSLRFEQLKGFSEQEPEVLNVSGSDVVFTTFRESLPDGGLLLVVQAFLPTLWFPNFVSLSGVGKVLSDGICVAPNGDIQNAPEDMLWRFR